MNARIYFMVFDAILCTCTKHTYIYFGKSHTAALSLWLHNLMWAQNAEVPAKPVDPRIDFHYSFDDRSGAINQYQTSRG